VALGAVGPGRARAGRAAGPGEWGMSSVALDAVLTAVSASEPVYLPETRRRLQMSMRANFERYKR
jgi:hypothetical protein